MGLDKEVRVRLSGVLVMSCIERWVVMLWTMAPRKQQERIVKFFRSQEVDRLWNSR